MFDVAIIVAIVVALTELTKRTFPVNKRYLPLASLILGLIAGFLYMDGSVNELIMYGLMIGLSASGLFDHTKVLKE